MKSEFTPVAIVLALTAICISILFLFNHNVPAPISRTPPPLTQTEVCLALRTAVCEKAVQCDPDETQDHCLLEIGGPENCNSDLGSSVQEIMECVEDIEVMACDAGSPMSCQSLN